MKPDGKHRIIELSNGEIRRGKYPFVYQDLMEPELDWMRKTEKLDEVVEGAKSEFEIIKRLAGWTAKQWMYGGAGRDGKHGTEAISLIHQGVGQGRVCGTYCIVFADALFSFGIQSRFLSIGTDEFTHTKTKKKMHYYHAVGDVWSNDHQKWVYVDGNFACYFEDENGIPQSIFELQEALLENDKTGIRLVFCGDYTESTAPIFRKFPRFRDEWFPYALRSLNIFHNMDLLMANNVHAPDWHSSGKGPKGEKLGAMRLYYKPDRPGFTPHFFDKSHYEVTSEIGDVTWNLYDIEIGLDHENGIVDGGPVPLRLTTFAPFMDCFLTRVNGGEWSEQKPSQTEGHDAELTYSWRLKPGLNTFEVRTRNRRGSLGVVRRLVLSDDPVSVVPQYVSQPGGISGGCGSVVWSARDSAFLLGPGRGGTIGKVGKSRESVPLTGPDGQPLTFAKFSADEAGNLVVASDHAVHRFDPTGKRLLTFGAKGSDTGQFMNIGGVAVSAEGRIAVSDADVNRVARVQVFDENGKHLRTIGKFGSAPGELNLPAELVYAPDGSLYVVDAGNHRVQRFDAEGKCLSQIGPDLPGYGTLHFPSGICLASHGERRFLYIVDTFNHRVVITDLSGRLVGNFGGYSAIAESEHGRFRQPRSIAVHDDDIVVLQPPVVYSFRR